LSDEQGTAGNPGDHPSAKTVALKEGDVLDLPSLSVTDCGAAVSPAGQPPGRRRYFQG
jgi:hypothetical protein